jgi:hypothetical protein
VCQRESERERERENLVEVSRVKVKMGGVESGKRDQVKIILF